LWVKSFVAAAGASPAFGPVYHRALSGRQWFEPHPRGITRLCEHATSRNARLSDDSAIYHLTEYCGTAIPTVSPPMLRSGFLKALRGDQYHRSATFPGQEKSSFGKRTQAGPV